MDIVALARTEHSAVRVKNDRFPVEIPGMMSDADAFHERD
jgi:hypothetical protein